MEVNVDVFISAISQLHRQHSEAMREVHKKKGFYGNGGINKSLCADAFMSNVTRENFRSLENRKVSLQNRKLIFVKVHQNVREKGHMDN